MEKERIGNHAPFGRRSPVKQRLPIVKPVWEFLSPDTGTVMVPSVASICKTTFLLLGVFGVKINVTGW